jgi:glycosyltransferase involved in cell wall biosynthesis
VAGAASRCARLTIFAQSESGDIEPDGAFDVVGIQAEERRWPELDSERWRRRPNASSIWIIDEPSEDAIALLDTRASETALLTIGPSEGAPARSLPRLLMTPATSADTIAFGPYVPVNPLAAASRHTGFGFTNYVLVLTDRSGHPSLDRPTPDVAWLTSRFYDEYVIAVEDGRAAAWKGRALRGVVDVHTRTDLWRLLAHAQVTVDLCPGNIIGRECIEALRFGTPIVVPANSVAAEHTRSGGGRTYDDIGGLLEAVELFIDERTRETASHRGLEYAAFYADPHASVGRMAKVLQGI